MVRQSHSTVMLPVRNDGDAGGHREVGRIELGTRQFIVLLAPDLPSCSELQEICRFEVVGLQLIVIEAGEQGQSSLANDLAGRLTGREFEIAVLVAQGHANKTIAHRLRISEWTVATYMRRIFAKLNVESRASMVFRCAPLISASLTPALGRDSTRARH